MLGRRRAAAVDAAPGPRQLRDRLGRRRRAAAAVRRRLGRHGDHRARHRLRLGEHQDHRGARRRRVRPQRREDLRHLRRPGRPHRGVGDPRPGRSAGRRSSRSSSPRARRGCGSSGSSTSSASGPPTPRRSSSRTAGCRRRTCSGSAEVDPKQGFAGAMATFDNTRPLVASMAVGCATAALDLTRELLEEAGVEVDYDRPAHTQSAAAAKFLQMEADLEGARLLMLQAAWMADNRQAQLARGLDGQGEGRPGRLRRHAVLRGAVRHGRLQRGRAAGEVGARLQDPRHLRGHPADPAADRRPAGPGAVEHRAK